MQKNIMQRSNQLPLEIRINVNTMAKELINLNKDSHRIGEDHLCHLVSQPRKGG